MITKKQKRVIELLFEGNLDQIEISEQLGIHPTTISRWKRNPDFVEAMRVFTESVIAKSTPKAMSTMVKLLDARSELVRYNAAKDLLDRAGFMPTVKQDIRANVGPVQITDDVPIGSDDDG